MSSPTKPETAPGTVAAVATKLYGRGQALLRERSVAQASQPAAANVQRLQRATRQQRDFAKCEAALPARQGTVHSNSALASAVASAGRLLGRMSPRLAGVVAYLGGSTSEPQPITACDSVWLLDNVAFADGDAGPAGADPAGPYAAEFVVAVMTQEPDCPVVDAVRDVAAQLGRLTDDDGKDDEGKDAETLATIEQRITPFLQDILPGRAVQAVHGDAPGVRLTLGPTAKNGLSSDVVALPSRAPGSVVETRAQVPAGATGQLSMDTFFAAPGRGWAVVSDVDDTIKRTMTSDPAGILQTTFVEAPQPVDGMPALYAHLHARLGTGAPFFYLSASPYSLYPFLRAFRRAHYPPGALILRDAELVSVAGLLSTLTLGTQAYKVDRMRKIHRWMPAKRVVCIGDSTQSDPEAYGDMARAFPGWVALVLIRRVADIAAVGLAEKNADARFEKAFAGVPRTTWHVFDEPDECYAILDRVLRSRHVV